MTDRNEFTICQLQVDQVPLFRDMLKLFGEVFDELGTYTAEQPDDDYIKELLGLDYFMALVALSDDKVVGALTAYEFKKFEQPRSEVYIYDLGVAASHRRRGIATGLILEVKELAKQRGAYVVIVQADQGDLPPTELYSKLGKREDVLHFDIDVD